MTGSALRASSLAASPPSSYAKRADRFGPSGLAPALPKTFYFGGVAATQISIWWLRHLTFIQSRVERGASRPSSVASPPHFQAPSSYAKQTRPSGLVVALRRLKMERQARPPGLDWRLRRLAATHKRLGPPGLVVGGFAA
ncbi:hypothetical protein L596_004360 [Steinernema carpocapsae]|uniref:Uncharacterized protein n=1 Tax=Steinernema carpocapsae TaxID=34508 RepID=A0A4U8UX36_STECR|nr:hypothetical protein L596_004360 [Steinernema carpocapsae]